MTDESTVEIMYSTLQGLLKLEKSSSFSMPKYPFTFSQDKVAIETGLAEIKTLRDSFVSTPSSSELPKLPLKSRILLLEQIIVGTPADKNEKDLKSKFLVQLLSLSSQLEVKAKHNARASSTLDAAQSSVELEKSDEDDSANDDLSMPVSLVSTPSNLPWCQNGISPILVTIRLFR